MFDAVIPGVVSLLANPENAPETYAVIAKAYVPGVGLEFDPPDTDSKLESAEYIELKIASNDEGLFINVFSNTVVFKVNNPDLSVLTPKFDK